MKQKIVIAIMLNLLASYTNAQAQPQHSAIKHALVIDDCFTVSVLNVYDGKENKISNETQPLFKPQGGFAGVWLNSMKCRAAFIEPTVNVVRMPSAPMLKVTKSGNQYGYGNHLSSGTATKIYCRGDMEWEIAAILYHD